MLAWHGPKDSPLLVVLAPGDSGRLEDTGPTLVAEGLARAGIRVGRCAFPPCDSRQGQVRDVVLADRIRAISAAREPSQALIVGGFSRGARVGASLVDELGAVGLLGFAYPFHPRQDPNPGGRVAQLAALSVPALIVQGTRDALGNREQVAGYRLPAHIALHWLEDANHALQPRPRSGFTAVQQLTRASQVAAAFIRRLQ